MKRASRRIIASNTRKKGAPKKSALKKPAPRKRKSIPKTTLGCCTLIGNGPDAQIERITQAACQRRARAAGRNYQWIPGDCAQPSQSRRHR